MGEIYCQNHNMMLCKESCTLLLYHCGYIELKFGKAAFLKFSQVMLVPATHMGFAKLTETADTILCTMFHFARSFHG